MFSVDKNEIKSKASQSITKGAVTGTYTLDIQEACSILNSALATEVVCVLRYRSHQIMAKGIDYLAVANEFEEHAQNEEQHMLRLAERINQLGGVPELNPGVAAKTAVTDYGHAVNLIDMIKEDLIAERMVIDVYRKMIAWFGDADPTTRRLLEDILEDEEEHADELSDLLQGRQHSSQNTSDIRH